ncbi:hypothetical protein QOZ80_2BG0158000 [Eleusine coracana subsp. coracana]|nr:hypothetical protein QOZ80_2BG0158000 [Eleusine coracana subsp. coracana]
MAPLMVLLDSFVKLSFEQEDGAAVAAEKNKGAVAAAPSLQSLMDSTISFLRSLTPDALLHHPPKVSTLRLRSSSRRLRDAAHGVPLSAVVACADKSMLVLYGGKYSGPGSSSRGCYLIYDAAVSGGSTLTATVPSLPLSPYLTSVGAGAVVLRRSSHSPASSSSSYILAELATTGERRLPDAELYLWRSPDDDSPTTTTQWEKKAVRLPHEVHADLDKHNFCVDTSFAFGDSGLCWVDLLRGIVVYHPDPHDQFRFIPLPEDGCPEYTMSHYPYRPRMSEFRAAACVAGAIKLVALEGYLEGWNDSQQFRFVTWTLTPDLRQWKKDAVFYVRDIWASDKYRALNISRQITPICPVLSPLDDAVYVIINDVEVHDIVKGSEVVETKVDIKGQYVLGLGIQNNQVISADGGRPTDSMVQLTPKLLATDFCACLQGPKDRQRDVKASEVVESGKRPKVY